MMYAEDVIALLKSETERLSAKVSFRKTLHEFCKPIFNVEYIKKCFVNCH